MTPIPPRKPRSGPPRGPRKSGPGRAPAARPAGRSSGPRAPGRSPAPAPKTAGWDDLAAWYDRLVGDEGSDYHRNVILPTALRLLDPQAGESFLDLCCGQGVLTRALLERDAARVLAVDASARLIEAAKRRGAADRRARFAVCDAARLGQLADERFDGAALIMAAQDVPDVAAVVAEMGRALRPGGRAVIVMMHPCFRVPRQSSWDWDFEKKTQYRRIDRYAHPMNIPIATRPGKDPGQQTVFHHRPLADYINALGAARLAVVACEEPLSHRRADPGGRSRGENRAAEEIPVFLALKAVRLSEIKQ